MATKLINWQPNTLEDDIVKVVPLVENDFDILYELASDPLIWEQHHTFDRYKKEVFQVYFNGAIAGRSAFKIVDKSSNATIGSTRYYDYKPENPSIAIGYTFLARKYWGKLYNKTSKKLLIDYAFQFVDKVYFYIGATNIRSQKAITKIGATKVREITDEQNGKLLCSFEYVIEKYNYK